MDAEEDSRKAVHMDILRMATLDMETFDTEHMVSLKMEHQMVLMEEFEMEQGFLQEPQIQFYTLQENAEYTLNVQLVEKMNLTFYFLLCCGLISNPLDSS